MAATLRVDIVTDADTRGIGRAESRLSSFAGKAAKYGRMAALGMGAIAVGAVVAGKKLWELGDASDDANASIGQGLKTMGLFGNQTDKVAKRIIKYAEATARATGVETNSIKATQAKLLTFGKLADSADKVGGNFDRATMAAIDLAAKGFGTAEGNAAQLGKALNDPVKGLASLAKAGVTFTETEKLRIAQLVESNRMGQAQAVVLRAIEKQAGGTAEAMAGGFDRAKITFTQLAEKIGTKLVPVVDRLGNWLVDTGLPAAKRFGNYVRDTFGPALGRAGEFITDKLIPAGRRFHSWFIEKIAPGIKKEVTPIIDGMKEAWEDVSKSVGDNEGELKDIGQALKKTVEFIAEHVLPMIGGRLGQAFKDAGKIIGATVTVLAGFVRMVENAYLGAKKLWDFIQGKNFGALKVAGTGPVTGSAALYSTVVAPVSGGSPSYDTRRGWTSAAAGLGGLSASMRTLATQPAPGGQVVDARTYLSVAVDGSGIVDEHKVAATIAAILARWANRLGRPITELLAAPGGVVL